MAENQGAKKSVETGKFSGGSLQPLLWVVLLSIILVKFPESIILLLVGLLPTMVAFIIDKSSGKYATLCVGTMNITGIFPSIFELWSGQNNFSQAIQIITNVFDLVIMYGTAGFGWILYIIIPSGVSVLLNLIAQRRITRLRNLQRDLISEWGKNVAVSREPEIPSEDQGSQKNPEPTSNNGVVLSKI